MSAFHPNLSDFDIPLRPYGEDPDLDFEWSTHLRWDMQSAMRLTLNCESATLSKQFHANVTAPRPASVPTREQ